MSIASWFRELLTSLADPAWAANLLSSLVGAAVAVGVAFLVLRRQLRHDREERRGERYSTLVEPLARALRHDSRQLSDLLVNGSTLIAELGFIGISQTPGRRSRQYPGQAAVLSGLDAAKPALPSPKAIVELLADIQDRWEVLHWVHQVRHGEVSISDSMKRVTGALDLKGQGCPSLVYVDVIPRIALRIFGEYLTLEDQLGVELHRWNGREIPDYLAQSADVPCLSEEGLRDLIVEVAGVFDEEEARAR